MSEFKDFDYGRVIATIHQHNKAFHSMALREIIRAGHDIDGDCIKTNIEINPEISNKGKNGAANMRITLYAVNLEKEVSANFKGGELRIEDYCMTLIKHALKYVYAKKMKGESNDNG